MRSASLNLDTVLGSVTECIPLLPDLLILCDGSLLVLLGGTELAGSNQLYRPANIAFSLSRGIRTHPSFRARN